VNLLKDDKETLLPIRHSHDHIYLKLHLMVLHSQVLEVAERISVLPTDQVGILDDLQAKESGLLQDQPLINHFVPSLEVDKQKTAVIVHED